MPRYKKFEPTEAEVERILRERNELEREKQERAQREREEYEQFGRRVADSRLYRWARIYVNSEGALLLVMLLFVLLFAMREFSQRIPTPYDCPVIGTTQQEYEQCRYWQKELRTNARERANRSW